VPTAPDTVVQLLQDARSGDQQAMGRLLPIVYDELRRLASAYLGHERRDHTLQPTALVHEVYLRLVGQRCLGCEDRTQFFAAAATVMRRVLVDHARAKKASKRGGDQVKTALDAALACFEERAYNLIALEDALVRLAALDERKARVVELRFFGGLTVEETSRFLGVPVRTIEREWTLAKAWLRGQLDVA
jgi:RNA polymerase sigma factor (TIGR02999 family)